MAVPLNGFAELVLKLPGKWLREDIYAETFQYPAPNLMPFDKFSPNLCAQRANAW